MGMWVQSSAPTNRLYWSWNEGKTNTVCSFGLLGQHSVHSLTTAPNHDGMRFHMLAKDGNEKHYVIMVDFTNLGEAQCVGADTPNTPASSYETWTPKDPDGERDCLLGAKTTYTRRKQNVKCFNTLNDLVDSTVSCDCDREDFECDDCYELKEFWRKGSECVRKTGPCHVPDPCAPGQVYFNQTRGYKIIAGDMCEPGASDDVWSPVRTRCDSTTTSTSVSTSSSDHGTSPPHSSHSSSSSTSSPATPTPTPAPGPDYKAIVAALVILLLVGGLVGGFLYARRQPGFQQRFGGRIPFVPRPEDPYSTLGELETSNAGFDEDF